MDCKKNIDINILFTGCESIPGIEPGMSLRQVLDVLIEYIQNIESGETNTIESGIGVSIIDNKAYLGLVSDFAGSKMRSVLGEQTDIAMIFGFNDGNDFPSSMLPSLTLGPSNGFSLVGLQNANITSTGGYLTLNGSEIKISGNVIPGNAIKLESFGNSANQGLQLVSQDGNVFKLVVDNNGGLSTVAL